MTDVVEPPTAAWYALPAAGTARLLDVDAAVGLSSTEADRRRDRDGPNRLDEPPREPRWRAFLLSVCHDTRSVLSRETLANTWALITSGAVVALLVLVVQVDVLHDFFTTTELAWDQWLVCAAIGSAVLWVV